MTILKEVRIPTAFEKLLLIIGGFVMIAGYILIQKLASNNGLNASLLQVVFLWLMLVMIIILVAVAEDMKEELQAINGHQLTEVRLLKEETALLREETSLMRQEMSALRNIGLFIKPKARKKAKKKT